MDDMPMNPPIVTDYNQHFERSQKAELTLIHTKRVHTMAKSSK